MIEENGFDSTGFNGLSIRVLMQYEDGTNEADAADGTNEADAADGKIREPRAESREPRAESREPRAESRDYTMFAGAPHAAVEPHPTPARLPD